MFEEPEPLAVIKVTFEDLPNEVKNNIIVLSNLITLLMITTLIAIYLSMIDTIINRAYKLKKYYNYERLN
jgi:hypothetical protein